MRGQIELPALGVALLLLTMTLVLGVGVAQDALSGADRSPRERQVALGVSDRLVDERGPVTVRANVLEGAAVRSFDEATLRDRYGLPSGTDVRVRLDDEVLAATGEPSGGTTVERIVLVEQRVTRTITPQFQPTQAVTLPRRTDKATLTLSPPANTTVTTVWANDRVLLSNDGGLAGEYDLSLSPFETTTLRFETVGPLDGDDVRVTFYPPETRKAVLEVTVDA